MGHILWQNLFKQYLLSFFGIKCKCVNICQQVTETQIGYGQLPPQDALITPWFEVAIDLI
jgi:hypothetical protein